MKCDFRYSEDLAVVILSTLQCMHMYKILSLEQFN